MSFSQQPISKKKLLSKEELKTWLHKDYIQDTIAGTSLEKAYTELLQNKKGKEIIVAVLDTKLDIFHEDLKDQIWVNEDEIPNNGIDDDNNGYIDDVNGWDFLSNDKGEFIEYQNYEETRVIRKYDSLFKGRHLEDVATRHKEAFKMYAKVVADYEASLKDLKQILKDAYAWREIFPIAKKQTQKILKKEKLTYRELDSLEKTKQKDTLINYYAGYMKTQIKNNIDLEFIKNYIKRYENRLHIFYNRNYDERKITGDNVKDINDRFYGYHKVYGRVPFEHSIVVSGILGAKKDNGIGIQGISNNIKIMPVVMVASGDEHDKDVALAIRYAVDNGASVINMSWGKNFSTEETWVHDAIKYAEKHDVLLVTAAGNEGRSIDEDKYYLNDYLEEEEIVNNFMVIGANNYKITERLVASFSNYGKKHVDIFAPGIYIYTTDTNNKYKFSRGTSLASPIVSGIAALIRSYYPNLSASEVKMILMESGTSFDLKVRVLDKNDKKIYVPFSELSKSGKVVNAYNALVLAEEISRKK
ncbi:S8 family serine peptidase [Kordia jejudonensis]|uniref:S8 family serine peptidase n=1 Tax=Kordia jejudonensis TaxID=1348245 RepID=UPI00138E0FF4|nr:S8 family serine peptidase [Kordia jejudonensis]